MKSRFIIFLSLSLFLVGLTNLNAQVSGEIDPTFKISKSWGPDNSDQFCSYSQHLPDGKWIVSGRFTRFSGHQTRNIARLLAGGDVDTTFTFTADNVFLKYVNPCLDGSYICTGRTLGPDCAEDADRIFKIKSNGELVENVEFQLNGDFISFVHLNADEKVLVRAGSKLTRCNPSGTIDTTFTVVENVESGPVILPDDKFLAITSDNNLRRYHKNGSIDSTFSCPVGLFAANQIFLDYAGRILISGGSLRRLHPNGGVDSSFRISVSGDEVIKQDSNWIYTATLWFGGQSIEPVFMRHDQYGNRDSTFEIRLPVSVGNRYAFSENGDHWAALGYFVFKESYPDFQMAFLDANGKRVAAPEFQGFDGDIRHIKVLPGGKILVAGDFNFFGKHPVSNIARLFPNGDLDTTFHSPFHQGNMQFGNWGIRNVSLSSEGQILLCGDFGFVGTSTRRQVALLNADGGLDTQFILDVSGLSTDTALTISNAFIGDDQKVYVKADLRYNVGSSGTGGRSIVFRSGLDGSRDISFPPRRYYNGQYYNAMYQGRNDNFYLQNSSSGFWWDGWDPPSPGQMCGTLSILKIRTNGSPDSTWPNSGGNSIYTEDIPGVDRISERKNGSIMVASHCYDSGVRFESISFNGIHKNYTQSGETYFYYEKPGIAPSSILLTPDSGFVYFRNGRNPVRLDKSDSVDQNFVNTAFLGGIVTDMAMADSNSFYVGGTFTHLDEKPVNRIARLKMFPAITTKVSEVKVKSDIYVFPNPGKDKLEIRMGSETNGKVQIRMVDAQGRRVVNQSTSENGNIKVPVSGLSRGLYVLHIITGNKVQTVKWIKE